MWVRVPHAPPLRVAFLTFPSMSPLHFPPRSAGSLPAFLTFPCRKSPTTKPRSAAKPGKPH